MAYIFNSIKPDYLSKDSLKVRSILKIESIQKLPVSHDEVGDLVGDGYAVGDSKNEYLK